VKKRYGGTGRKALCPSSMKTGAIRSSLSAGCRGGEEPYTFAIIWLDRLRQRYPYLGLEILATDIDEAALERAKDGRYAKGSLKEIPAGSLENWFSGGNGLWSVDERVKRLVRFGRHNLQTDPPPRAMDIVLCRYLAFTYYTGERLLSAAMRIHDALRPGGLLMIGRKESVPSTVLKLTLCPVWVFCEAVEYCAYRVYRLIAFPAN
jgi:chemotaxis methyl-accepting protein methylase